MTNLTKFDMYWGIDISKQWLDIAEGGKVVRLQQDEEAIRRFIL